jgi:hypothetical protein
VCRGAKAKKNGALRVYCGAWLRGVAALEKTCCGPGGSNPGRGMDLARGLTAGPAWHRLNGVDGAGLSLGRVRAGSVAVRIAVVWSRIAGQLVGGCCRAGRLEMNGGRAGLDRNRG